MYFKDAEHEMNFNFLLEYYKMEKGTNSEYEAAYYVAAVPDIFKCFNEDSFKTDKNPLFSLADYEDEQNAFSFSHQALTDSTRALCEFALSLFNGHPIDLGYIVAKTTKEFHQVLLQAINIRANQ